MIRRLLKRLLYGGSSSLRKLEASCLTCLRNALPPQAREILESQLHSIDLIQRFSDEKLVVFHLAEKQARLFPNRSPELYAAKLIIPRKSQKSLVCEFVFHEGRISSMEFNRSPRAIGPSAVICTGIELLEDLMTSPRVEVSSTGGGRMLAAVREQAKVDNAIGPEPLEKQQLLLQRVGAFAAPDDYAELLSETDGFVADGWLFMGTRARKIVLSDRTYFVAAESVDGQTALCFRDGEQKLIIVVYNEVDDREEPAGDRFIEAFIKALREWPTARSG